MSTQEREKINLNELSERELLILLNRQVGDLERKCERIDEVNQKLMLKVNTLETKSRVWGAVAAFITTIITLLLEKILKL